LITKKRKQKKKSQIPPFNPIISDGRFLYAVVPIKPEKDETKDNSSDEKKEDANAQHQRQGSTNDANVQSLAAAELQQLTIQRSSSYEHITTQVATTWRCRCKNWR